MKTKILHIITRFTKGGADENTKLTCLGLNKDKYNVYLAFGNEYDKEEVNEVKKSNIKTRCFPMLRHLNPVSSLLSLIPVYLYIKKNRFTIVHTHSTEAGLIGRLAAIFARVPIIIHTVHGSPFSETRPYLVNFLTLIGERTVAKKTTKIISNADILTREYLDRSIGTGKQYVTIRSGIDLERFKDARIIKKIRDRAKFNVLMVSRITEGKGFDELIEAANILKNKDIHFFVAGEGDLFDYYRKRSKSISEYITFLGFRKDISSLLKSSDVLVLPSYREGTPRVITEAMAASIPVIATNIGGIPEQVEDNKTGFLISIKNSKLLAEKILYLLKNPEKAREMGMSGYRRVSEFSKEKMLRDIDKLYSDLLHSLKRR